MYEAIKFIDPQNKVQILALHGHQGSIESALFAFISRPFVWLYGKVLEKVFRHAPRRAEPNTKIDSNYEKVYYECAMEKGILLICGHSHYAIFESKCYANRLQTEIDALNERIRDMADRTNKAILAIQAEALSKRLKIEKKRKREITPTSANAEPKPCYFNTGCCLYDHGITCIELDEDSLRLVKWNKDTESGSVERLIYGEGTISEYCRAIAL